MENIIFYINAFKTKYKYFDEIVNVSEGAKQSFIAKTKIDQKRYGVFQII